MLGNSENCKHFITGANKQLNTIDDQASFVVCTPNIENCNAKNENIDMTNCYNPITVENNDYSLSNKNNNCSLSAEENSLQKPQFSSPLPTEFVKFVDESTPVQVFTPILMGRTRPRFKTYIQLDSGASTNLIGAKMARYLRENNLINFTYPSIKTLLTDVQHNESPQPFKPFNVTLHFDTVDIDMCFHVLQDLEYRLLE